jgi:hypothetical protein
MVSAYCLAVVPEEGQPAIIIGPAEVEAIRPWDILGTQVISQRPPVGRGNWPQSMSDRAGSCWSTGTEVAYLSIQLPLLLKQWHASGQVLLSLRQGTSRISVPLRILSRPHTWNSGQTFLMHAELPYSVVCLFNCSFPFVFRHSLACQSDSMRWLRLASYASWTWFTAVEWLVFEIPALPLGPILVEFSNYWRFGDITFQGSRHSSIVWLWFAMLS